jgi:hypothetical protein
MSFNRLEDSSSSSPNNNNRVEPNFFGSSSLYQQPSKKNDTADSSGTENPHWSNPPPPYSPTTTASDSLQSDQPSAPPLETAPSVYSDPLQRNSNQQQQPYPPVGYGQYGTVNPNNNTISDHIPNWPWIAPPSTTAGKPSLGAFFL